jgi:pimeloyl-ACP methyl ester carboxylesterase
MAMSSSEVLPVVMVHGAWHGGWCFSDLQTHLDRRGVASYAVDLPGHGTSTAAPTDLHGDGGHVAGVVRSITTRHRLPVVLMGHSYGGAVVGDALSPDLMECVAAVVYVAAFALLPGEAVNDIVRAYRVDDLPLGAAIRMGHDGTSTLDPQLAVTALYGTTDPALIDAAIARLEPQAMVNLSQPVRHSPFDGTDPTGRPRTIYVRCLRDRAVPPIQQDAMAPRCDEVITLDVDHCPHLSAPQDLAAILTRMATGGSNGER